MFSNYSGFLLTVSCGKQPVKKHEDFIASMLKISDSLRALDTNNKVAYFIEEDGAVVCDVTLRNQNIKNNQFELPQCEDCFTFHTGKSQTISNTDSFMYYGQLARRLFDDILNKTPKGLIWKRFKILYDNPQDTFSFCRWFIHSKHWGVYSGGGKKVL